MCGDGLHAAPAVLGLGVGIIVGVRVDVVGIGASLRVLDELDAGNTDVVRGQEGLPSCACLPSTDSSNASLERCSWRAASE
jgi:hypothetical protein